MLNPLGSNAAPLAYGSPATDLERPAAPPEPAVNVTAASNASGSGSATTAPQDREAASDSPNSLEKALEDVNNNMKAWATGMRFDVDPDANRVVVSIIDSATGEVLRTVPSDAVIRVAKMIVQMQGNAVNTKA
ncbi:MAG TPA: flagellar protein FlaG [Candidimonas sp.]|nr:flagellar protein FlaG [Candidimonas sp.]